MFWVVVVVTRRCYISDPFDGTSFQRRLYLRFFPRSLTRGLFFGLHMHRYSPFLLPTLFVCLVRYCISKILSLGLFVVSQRLRRRRCSRGPNRP